MTPLKALSLIFIFMASSTAISGHAAILEFKFGSKEDFFKLKKVDGKWTMNGKDPVSLKPFMKFVPLFSKTMDEECEGLPKRPDLSVTATTEITNVKRHFYIGQGVVSDGTNCLSIAGDGIYFLPYHRHWFTGSKKVKIKLGKRLLLRRSGEEFLSFKMADGEWRNENPDFFTHWDYFDKFLGTVKTMNITFRLHPAYAKGKSSFELTTGKKTYIFYQVKDGMWAVKLPTTPWLISSNQWSLFENMELSNWISPQSGFLKQLANKNAPLPDRFQAIANIGNLWSKTIKHAYQNVVLDPDDSAELKYKVVRVLRTHPSDDNMLALADALSQTSDIRLMNYMTKSLRIKNPKGPVITDEDDPGELEDKVDAWKKWAREHRRKLKK